MSKGTYVAVRVLPSTATNLAEYCRVNGINIEDKGPWERRLHSTILYSRKHCPNLVAESGALYAADFDGFDYFTGDEGKRDVLVVKLHSPMLEARHNELMHKHNATYDYPTYNPHITLAYGSTVDLTKLPPITFNIFLGMEYVEDLEDV